VNCSTAPEDEDELQPVQFVSIATEPGEMETPFVEVMEDDPPQPASRRRAGNAAMPNRRAARGARK